MFKYRDHRGSLCESVATTQEFADKEGLLKYLAEKFEGYGVNIDVSKVTIEPFVFDSRTGWDCHLVYLDGYGVFGYTDRKVDD